MSRMLPPVYGDDIKSYAEKRMFDLLRTDPNTRDWTCLHSLGLARHCKQVYGEIDFVVMIPDEGIFSLEVKGGNVARTDGVWTFTNKFGERNSRTKSPFAQVKDNMFSLTETLRSAFGHDHRVSRLLHGWAVLFPDIVWDREEVEARRWQIYDRDFKGPISTFLRRLAQETHMGLQNKILPTHEDIEELTRFLRGDFELVEAPTRRLEFGDDQIRRMTEEQFQCLDGMERNRRCFFEGGAGTGKTFLALETVKRESRTGCRVLFVCFNRLIGAWLSAAVPAARYPSITTQNFHGLLERLIAGSTLQKEFEKAREDCYSRSDKQALFREIMPFYAILAMSDGTIEPFDMIVVDEGQDLITREYLDVLDCLLKGGLAGGRWTLFCDLHRQAIFQHGEKAGHEPDGVLNAADQMRSLIAERAPYHASFRLTVNCRNTRPIGEETALLSGFDVPPFLHSNLDGPSVDYRFYSDAEEQRSKLAAILTELQREGLPPAAIHILSPVSRHQSVVAKFSDVPIPIFDLDDRSIISPNAGIGFATIQAYKGLENSVIIITDVRHLDTQRDQSILYVGMSRARQRLYLLLSDEARPAYNAAVKRNFLKGRQHI